MFTSIGMLETHHLLHEDKHNASTSTSVYRCGFCLRVFISQADLNLHVPLHQTGMKHACRVCDVKFYTQQDLLAHIETTHGGTNIDGGNKIDTNNNNNTDDSIYENKSSNMGSGCDILLTASNVINSASVAVDDNIVGGSSSNIASSTPLKQYLGDPMLSGGDLDASVGSCEDLLKISSSGRGLGDSGKEGTSCSKIVVLLQIPSQQSCSDTLGSSSAGHDVHALLGNAQIGKVLFTSTTATTGSDNPINRLDHGGNTTAMLTLSQEQQRSIQQILRNTPCESVEYLPQNQLHQQQQQQQQQHAVHDKSPLQHSQPQEPKQEQQNTTLDLLLQPQKKDLECHQLSLNNFDLNNNQTNDPNNNNINTNNINIAINGISTMSPVNENGINYIHTTNSSSLRLGFANPEVDENPVVEGKHVTQDPSSFIVVPNLESGSSRTLSSLQQHYRTLLEDDNLIGKLADEAVVVSVSDRITSTQQPAVLSLPTTVAEQINILTAPCASGNPSPVLKF